jgi:hypothetical protein
MGHLYSLILKFVQIFKPEVVRIKRRQDNPTCLIRMLMVYKKIKGIRNQFVWEPFKNFNFKFGGQF